MKNLSDALEDYLRLRRGFGCELITTGRYLRNFVSYAMEKSAAYITIDLAMDWALKPEGVLSSKKAQKLGIVRRFAQYLSTIDPRTEVPPQGLLPFQFRRPSPYIYTDDEIVNLLNAARQLKSANGIRAMTYSTLFGIIAVTGMRVSEAISLNRDDVNLMEGIITIRRTKFGKTRMVPLHPSTISILEGYVSYRDRVFPKLQTPSFFVSDRGKRLTDYTLRYNFTICSRRIGLRGTDDSRGPRMHDLRHTFAVQTLIKWYKEGINVEQQIPKLSTYLGHVTVRGTYWYLSAKPELLQLAAKLLEKSGYGRLYHEQ